MTFEKISKELLNITRVSFKLFNNYLHYIKSCLRPEGETRLLRFLFDAYSLLF
jgi:hypothetical protein